MTENPIELFKTWFQEASAQDNEANAFSLATVDEKNHAQNRIVLLKHYDERGFVFYTNLNSKKSKELQQNPSASICFYWKNIYKQIRIEGHAELVSDTEADQYFQTRPRDSQISAWASKQSEAMLSENELMERFALYTEQFKNAPVPRPPFWSGYRIIPHKIEFWTGGKSRLHSRVIFEYNAGSTWKKECLFP